jgi:hypothetical protein
MRAAFWSFTTTAFPACCRLSFPVTVTGQHSVELRSVTDSRTAFGLCQSISQYSTPWSRPDRKGDQKDQSAAFIDSRSAVSSRSQNCFKALWMAVRASLKTAAMIWRIKLRGSVRGNYIWSTWTQGIGTRLKYASQLPFSDVRKHFGLFVQLKNGTGSLEVLSHGPLRVGWYRSDKFSIFTTR